MIAVAVVESVPSITCDTNIGMTSKENKWERWLELCCFYGCLVMRFQGSLLLQEEWRKVIFSAMWYFLVVMSRKKPYCSCSVEGMGSPAESHNSTEVWGTGTCRMSGSIWEVLRESSCHPVLAVGSRLCADSINLNADVDLYVPLACPGAPDPAVLQLICQKNRVSNRTTKAAPLVKSILESRWGTYFPGSWCRQGAWPKQKPDDGCSASPEEPTPDKEFVHMRSLPKLKLAFVNSLLILWVPESLDFFSNVCVSVSGIGMGMTAPVSITAFPAEDGSFQQKVKVSLRIPSQFQDSPPCPTDESIKIEERQGMTIYST